MIVVFIMIFTLAPPPRELTDPNKTAGEGLHSLAGEVVEVMKGTCGKEEFSRAYTVVHRRALDAREKRKKHAALEVSGGHFSG